MPKHMLGEHGNGVVDELDVSVTAGIVGKLLTRQPRDQCGPEVEVLPSLRRPTPARIDASPVEHLDGDGIGLRRRLEFRNRSQEEQLVARRILCGEVHEEMGNGRAGPGGGRH